MRSPGSLPRIEILRRRSIVLLLVFVASLGAGGYGHPTLAQIACEPPATGAASPAPATTPVAATETVPFPEDGGELTIFAAASLTDAFGTMEESLESSYPDLDIVIETGGSQSLVTQLQEGAEADVLATANTSTMTTALESGLIDGEPVTFTGNRLVIVTPQDNPASIEAIDDLAGDDILLVVANEAVPAGNYARQVLCAYVDSGAAPDAFLDGVAANVASEEEDVRNVLAKVQLGEADAGLVYASDAVAAELAGEPVNVIDFPDTLDTTAVYPIAPVAGGDADLATAFIAYVLGANGQATLSDYGFALPGS